MIVIAKCCTQKRNYKCRSHFKRDGNNPSNNTKNSTPNVILSSKNIQKLTKINHDHMQEYNIGNMFIEDTYSST